MQNDSNLKRIQPETSVSNAVLTPHQIHPNFFKVVKYRQRVNPMIQPKFEDALPLSKREIEQRQKWIARQLLTLATNPSNAVLGA